MYTFLNVATALLALTWLAVAIYGTLGIHRTPRLRNFAPLPDVMIKILNDGGLLAHIEKHGDFKID